MEHSSTFFKPGSADWYSYLDEGTRSLCQHLDSYATNEPNSKIQKLSNYLDVQPLYICTSTNMAYFRNIFGLFYLQCLDRIIYSHWEL